MAIEARGAGPADGVLDGARKLTRQGWSVIPVPPGEKNPELRGWPDLRLTERDLLRYFPGNRNLGLLTGNPSNGLTDVDLDCEEAVALASEVLPFTPMWSGRATRPRSHAWYQVSGGSPENLTLKDIDRTTLVELRGTGRQTLVPPSVHPDGERYQWDGPLEPAAVEGQELVRAVRSLGGAALLARHWPRVAGSRHEIANALAGWLLRAGWSEKDVEQFVGAVARAAGDEEAKQRAKDSTATARTMAHGKRATGGPTLARLLGRDVVGRLRDLFGVSTGLTAYSAFTAYTETGSAAWPDPLEEPAYHGVVGEFVRMVEPHTEADPAALLVQFLIGIGNLVGRGPHFMAEADKHYTNLFGAFVGRSAKGRKGTSKGHVDRVLRAIDEDWFLRRQHGGLSSGEGLIWAVRDAIWSRSPIRKGGRVQGYEDVESDPGISDKRLLAFEPELASTLRVMGRDGNTLSALTRQAWDTGNLQVLTKNNPAKATAAHISIIGHVTKDELVRYLDRTEVGNGFANRFLWICVRRGRVLPDGGQLHTVDFAPLFQQLSQVVSQARGRGVAEVRRDEGARELWHEVYEGLSAGRPGLLGAVTSRAEAQVMRLALVYALLDHSDAISRSHLEAALAVWNYADASARFIFGDAVGDPIADELLQCLRSRPEGMTRNEMREHFKRNKGASQINRSLTTLQEHGLARFEMEPTGGRPAERWFAVTGNAVNAVNVESPSLEPPYRVNGVPDTIDTDQPASEPPPEEPPADDDEVVL